MAQVTICDNCGSRVNSDSGSRVDIKIRSSENIEGFRELKTITDLCYSCTCSISNALRKRKDINEINK